MTQEKLEHEIKVLEEALAIYKTEPFTIGGWSIEGIIKDKTDQLEALKKPQFRDGMIGNYISPDGTERGKISIYPDPYWEDRTTKWTFEPLPIETILRHLAPEGAVGWEYNSYDSVYLTDKNEKIVDDHHGNLFIIPAPYREDWKDIKGEL